MVNTGERRHAAVDRALSEHALTDGQVGQREHDGLARDPGEDAGGRGDHEGRLHADDVPEAARHEQRAGDDRAAGQVDRLDGAAEGEPLDLVRVEHVGGHDALGGEDGLGGHGQVDRAGHAHVVAETDVAHGDRPEEAAVGLQELRLGRDHDGQVVAQVGRDADRGERHAHDQAAVGGVDGVDFAGRGERLGRGPPRDVVLGHYAGRREGGRDEASKRHDHDGQHEQCFLHVLLLKVKSLAAGTASAPWNVGVAANPSGRWRPRDKDPEWC